MASADLASYLLEEGLCVWDGGLCGAGGAVIISQGAFQLIFLWLPLSFPLLLLLLLGWLTLALEGFSFP